ncbi:universal stress protein [Roseinatronobacter monicus]|uniref:Nucleotide-binding universal stress UspA family protein n=1 Tax=Roseinatronobacter monicus TaxID=393481 RepID=A0A543K608_9RHOB|nr:universal stress protein [Roseinatronobacter monicus]TQM90501.1 nucleotide-binding universal stress UspA family protein [Roseinatronobacter monicus]
MSETYLIAFDGSAASERALEFGAERAHASKARLLLAHVLEWSPYSFLSAEEVAERHKRRTEEVGRAETVILEPVRIKLIEQGLRVETVVRYGHVAEVLGDLATEYSATQIIVGRSGEKGLQARLFGSVAGTLAQAALVPCTIVP